MNLSICIATYGRAEYIGQTLESITRQLRPGVEVVVVDGASPDNTSSVMSDYIGRLPAIRYFREDCNSGVDGDYDKAVGYASGEYCWLMTDDDLLAPGAIDRVLAALEGGGLDLLIVDSEIRDASMTRVLRSRRLGFSGERLYGSIDSNALLRDTGDALTFIGGTIIRRRLWASRERCRYLGSLFIHVGVIFQAPPFHKVKVLGEPLVIIRAGNAMWRPRSFEIWAMKWPSLIWGFEGYTEQSKRTVTQKEPWRQLKWLFHFRAMGAYSIAEYRQCVSGKHVGAWRLSLYAAALFPGRLANALYACLLAIMRRGDGLYDLVVCSRYSNSVSRLVAKACLRGASFAAK